MAGLQNANEDMAASYARRAAIRFTTDARVLRRQVAVNLQPDVTRYAVDVFADERAVGVARVESARGVEPVAGRAHIDQARQEIVFTPGHRVRAPAHLMFTVWAAPTEDACLHDAFLYEVYRAQITRGARAMMMAEVHAYGVYLTNQGRASARGDALMVNRADRLEAEFARDIRRALVDVETEGVSNVPPPDLWAGAGARSYERPRR
jgi:hypothetical protein